MSKLLGVLLAGFCATAVMAQPGQDLRHGAASPDARVAAHAWGDHDRDLRRIGDRDHDRDDRGVATRDHELRHAGWPGHDNGNHYGWYRNGHEMRGDRDRDDQRHARFDRDDRHHARFDRDDYRHHARFDRDDYRHRARFDRDHDRDDRSRLHHVKARETHQHLRMHAAMRRHEEHFAGR